MGLFDRFRKKEAGISEDVIAAMADPPAVSKVMKPYSMH